MPKVLSSEDYLVALEVSEIVAGAKEQAESIIEQAKEAFEEEKRRGYEEGLAQSKCEQSEQMINMVGRSINYLSEIENKLADTLMSAVRKIIDKFDDNKLALELIRGALVHVRNERQVNVRVPPADFNYVKDRLQEVLADYKGIGFVTPVADPRLTKGGCIIESKLGIVDASLDIQLKALEQSLNKLKSEIAFGASEENNLD